jgi:hypothetical protein
MQNLALKSATPSPGAFSDSDREAVLAQYRRYRALSRAHNSRILKQIPGGAFLKQARRIGLARGKTVEAEEMDELFLVLDLAIHTAPPDRMRPIDRYARTVDAEADSDDERVLEAMRQSRFAILGIERRHEIAGLIVRDVSSLAELWLMDEHLESSAGKGLFATRLFSFDDFHITAGIIVPVNEALLRDALLEVPFLANRPWPDMTADRRFAEALYRVALESGVMDNVRYADVEAPTNVVSEARRQ